MRPASNTPDRGPTGSQKPRCGWVLALIAALAIDGVTTATADSLDTELSRAQQLVRDSNYEEAYQLLLPLEARAQDDAAFNALLGESALRTNRADQAVTWFRRSLKADPDLVDAHLGLARAYLAMGNYASAKIEFETVLRIDDLPNDLHQQTEIYAQAAQDYAKGSRLLPYGYAMAGYGNYSVNATDGTDEFGGSDTDDNFLSARGGGGLTYQLDDNYALNGSLDYRYRDYYDNDDRRDDKDLRWNGAVNRNLGEDNVAVGVRGRASYRGNGDWRNDYGLYGNWRHAFSSKDQFDFGAEFRRRDYPHGPLRERSRNIAELTLGWTHALLDGTASFGLVAAGGREFATDDRPAGDSNFFSLSPSFNFTLTETLGGFVFGWWQHDAYNIELLNVDAADNVLNVGEREDDLYEAGAGLTWEFADYWSLNPEILYIYDDSNILAEEYSSTEIWFTVRRDF
jgi:tetratricopeptide (TPR) repeat protein